MSYKKFLPDVLVVVLLAVISFAYFFPADIEGRILYRHDSSAGRALGQEATEYYQRTGERTRWTNALFGGMPTYQTSPSYESTDLLSAVGKAYHLWLPKNVWFVFAYLLGFYILLRAFDFRWYLALLGAVVWAFSSYFFIIIAAGHLWKVMALAYLPPLIAGVVLAFRGRYVWALGLTALFSALEVQANHVQMTYYYLIVIFAMAVAFAIDALRRRQYGHLLRAVGVCVVGAAIGICINLSNLYHTWEYGKESMRGGSELATQKGGRQVTDGLDRDYITQWSYGIGETWTLLIPNAKGGASVPLWNHPTAQAKALPEYSGVYQQIGQYWGEQPGTSGPVYVGAAVLMLFILGLLVVKGPLKWALLLATILSVLLSWGRNWMALTDFFIDYVPMYAKFRTVASILVVAEFTIPLLAMLGLRSLLDDGKEKEGGDPSMTGKLLVAAGLTAGACLLLALVPSLLSPFVSSSEMQALSQIPADQLQPLLANLTDIRQAIFTADCWRSFWIVVIAAALLLAYRLRVVKRADGRWWIVAALTVLCLVDMWTVNKRYLNDGMFVSKTVREQPIQTTATEEQILQDKSLDYRVLNLASNTFNENETSFYFKSIGGYHPAKLRRYQDLIDAYIQPEMQQLFSAVVEAEGDMTRVNGDSIFPVLNMLNAKYFILPLQGGQTVPVQNPYTYGNAWFVDEVKYVGDADGELAALRTTDLRFTAVADRKFSEVLRASAEQDTLSLATLKSYEPNRLVYNVSTGKGGVVVFSEIFYPGWEATIDGQPAELGRVDYVLRALRVPAGRHEVVLSFFPKSVERTELVAYCSYGVLLLILLAAGFLAYRRGRNRPTTDSGAE
ncbi:MAG: YfhO family protein [Prevotella sp.]|nr:YfhO family protein [Prevotella sp.]